MTDDKRVQEMRDRLQAWKEARKIKKQDQDAWFDLGEELSLLRALKNHVLHDKKQNFALWHTSTTEDFEERIDRSIQRLEEEQEIMWRMLMKEI